MTAMALRAVAVCLIVVALPADAAGAHTISFYALVLAVPAAAAVALATFGSALDARADTVAALQALLWALCLALVVMGCAARAPALETGGLPTFATSTLHAALLVLAVKVAVVGATLVRSRLVRGLQPRATRA
jgi:hypothetical protein